MTTTNTTAFFGGAPSEANNHVEHTTTAEMPEYIAASTLQDQEKSVQGWRTSIYKFYFPLVAASGETRNPYKCIRHMLAILGKQCNNQFRVLPKNEKDNKNEPIDIWTNFPSSKDAAAAYLFNIRYPQQNFGARAGAVDFVTELRVSTVHSASWLKQQDALVTEFRRHKYWLRAREDSPPVPIRPILWLGGPDPDNCSTSNLRALLQAKAPTADFLHLEKHRLTSKPDGQTKVFVTHVLKVSAPTDTAWSASRQLLSYLNTVPDNQKPVQLRGVKGVPMSNRDISKPALAAAITEQNKYLDHSAAVQMVNVWKLDTEIVVTDALLEALAKFELDEMTEPNDVRPYLDIANTDKTNIRNLLYAMVASRPDINTRLIKDDYIRGRSWNLVCDTDVVQEVSFVADTFLGALNRALSPATVARMCGSNNPDSIDRQPRVEYIKHYEGDSTVLQPTFGTSLNAFAEQYGVPLDAPQKPITTDFSKPPRATFAQAHLQRTRVISTDRASWAAVVYEAAFDQKEPNRTPFRGRKRKPKQKPTQSQTQPAPPSVGNHTSQPEDQPSDTPTNAPEASTTVPVTPNHPTQQSTPPPTSQYQLKVDAMETAIAQMQNSNASLNETIQRLETNVEKISSSVELLAKSQTDLQSKFESFLAVHQSAKENQTTELKELIDAAMHEHVYPQLNTILSQSNARLDSIEDALGTPDSTPSSKSSHATNNPYGALDEDMDSSPKSEVSGHKHHGSPSRSFNTPPPKRTNQSFTSSANATPVGASRQLFPASQQISGFTEQSQLSGGSE